ncbi:hypothetical protein [Caballeronia sp. RCC_10]|uniref:hypothetical protein n=1 Tax=Caballeronia sp. RCC_10 TaxID=3239227 RepID=UPI003523CBC2
MNARATLRLLFPYISLMCLLATQAAHAAQSAHAMLIPEGAITLIRGTTVIAVDAPLALQPGDLLATDAHTSAQIDYDDGTLAALAADTRLAIDATDSLALLSGWIKVTRKHAAAPSAWTIDTTGLRAVLLDGSIVMHADADAVSMFIEYGNIALSDDGRGQHPQNVSGEHYVQRSRHANGTPLNIEARPASAFLAAVPLPFRDPLAAAAARIASKETLPAQERTAAYADIGDWLTTSLPVRHTFVARFGPLAQAQPFRAQVQRHLRDLPDWRRVLCPPAPQRRRAIAPAEARTSDNES